MILRLVLVLVVILGMVLPKTSAALAGIGVSNTRTVVICTGIGMQTITLDADGVPVAPAIHHDLAPCLLIHTLDGALTPTMPLWVMMSRPIAPDRACAYGRSCGRLTSPFPTASPARRRAPDRSARPVRSCPIRRIREIRIQPQTLAGCRDACRGNNPMILCSFGFCIGGRPVLH